MIISKLYTKGLGNAALGLRASKLDQFWDWVALASVGAESADTFKLLTEYARVGDAVQSKYEKDIVVPLNGPWFLELVDIATGLTIATGSTEDIAATLAAGVTVNPAPPTLAEIEASAVLAKEATLVTIASYVDTEVQTIVDALAAVGGLTGAHQVTLQFYETATTIPIADISVDVYDSTNTARRNGSSIKSGSNGQLTFNRDNGVYKIRAMLAGVTFTLGTVTVADGDVTQILYGTPIALPSAGGADTCTVWLYCFMPDGSTHMTTDKAKGRAKIKSLPFTQNGKFHSGQEIPGTYDSGTGVMEWLFPWGARVEFTIPNILQKVETVTIPSVGVSNLEDLVS